ncbi:MAG: hypothetical protein ABI747_02015 [Candidatus Moraniibacteriota bacterium]
MHIVGHAKNRVALHSFLEKKDLPQSYLFSGPRSIGKKLVALEFALGLVGKNEGTEISHPDILVIGAEKEEGEKGKMKQKKISVEQIRDGMLFLSRFPTIGERRVLIVDEAEELSLGASNALLKGLEEPNTTSILILVTHRPGALLPTLLSRMVPFTFHTVEKRELEDFFSHSKEKLPQFFFSLGLPGLIFRALDLPESFRQHQDLLGKLFRISTLPLRERIQLAEDLSRDEEALPLILEEWLTGMHFRVRETGDARSLQKLLLLFDRIQVDTRHIFERQGSARLFLEKILLAL